MNRGEFILREPLAEFSMGELNGSPCVIFKWLGQDGNKATLIFEEVHSIDQAVQLLEQAKDMLAITIVQGLDAAVAIYGNGNSSLAPDDISTLFGSTDGEEGEA